MKCRDRNVIQMPVAQPRPVEPVDLAPEPCADDDVVEGAQRRQQFAELVSCGGIDQRRFRLDPQTIEQGQQQGGLRLAVPVAPGPGRIRLGRRVAPKVHQEGDVPDLVLHQPQGHLGPYLGIRRCGIDPLDLPPDR